MLKKNTELLKLLTFFLIIGMGYAKPVALSIENVNTTAGTLDINLTTQAGCSYCTDDTYPTKENCEAYGSTQGNGVVDATWAFDPASAAMDEAACTVKNGQWFNGVLKGYQFFLEGITIASISGGLTDQYFNCNGCGFVNINSNADCDADGTADTGCNLIVATSFGTSTIPVSTDQLLFTANFSDYTTGICFSGTDVEPSGSWAPPAFSDPNGDEVDVAWPACDCAAASPIDDCGVCGGGNAAKDCAGVCYGSATTDNCNVCDANPANDCSADCSETEASCDSNYWGVDVNCSTGTTCPAACWGGSKELDCAGVCAGTAVRDDCFVCEGTCQNPGTDNAVGCNASGCCGDAVTDCKGTCGGVAIEDSAGTCCYNADLDCAEVCSGTSVEDNCDNCLAPDAVDTDGGSASCSKDCAGTWGGTAADADSDGVCDTSDNCSDSIAGETVDAYGCTDAQNLSVTQTSLIIPREFSVSQNYPNPFNPTTNISFDVDRVDNVSLKIYDLSGKEVVTLVSGVFAPGSYVVSWDAINNYGEPIVSGMYVYRYTNSNTSIARKMLYLK